MAAPMKLAAQVERKSQNSSKTMRLTDFDAVGFDLDHTLAKYDLNILSPQIMLSILTYLVDEKGYSKSLLTYPHPLDKYMDLCSRGLLFDTARGNIIKVSSEGVILRATHGTKLMTDDEIDTAYGKDRHFPHIETICGHVTNIDTDWIIFDNHFDTPYGIAAAMLVDLLDKEAGQVAECYKFWPDVREAINYTYDPKHFSLDKGGFFPVMKKELEGRVSKVSKELRQWLIRLREQNIVTFMLTSSFADYSQLLMDFIFEGDWRQYFDLNLSFAHKPSFFKVNNPFINLENCEETCEAENLKTGKCYSQGSAHRLTEFVTQHTGKTTPRILYVGDSIRSDIFTTKVLVDWQNIVILEEMRVERTDDSDDLYVDDRRTLSSETWGSFFFDEGGDGNGTRYPNTLWSRLIYTYSDLAIPGLEYICHLPLDYDFGVFTSNKKSDGFFPAPPSSLKY